MILYNKKQYNWNKTMCLFIEGGNIRLNEKVNILTKNMVSA